MAFLHRFGLDPSQPTFAQAWNDLVRRTLIPALGLWLAIVSIGLLIVGPLDGLPGEVAVNEALAASRTPALDAFTAAWSAIGGTLLIIAVCAVVMAVVWWRTRQWWLAVVPAIAISVQSAVFVTSAAAVGRGRPGVEPLDVSPPTSGFPSGHVGASTAFYVTLALLCQRISHPVLRWAATAACLAVPLLVAYSRLYRGMHHPSDVLVGMATGLVCAWLAWRYLRRDAGQTRA
ncbi:phosphatase PAP2 family protein [Cellulomonas sp. KRMCY2]|uniref:phosphatase PAP2 family protein n=1 Tax=Cellulomonas sp. KRMCY2 TaxID=1304865 RepID=UPI0004A2D980|nr:phosphatase PAP2 family protein [Cellulomonas sp. KRMCY2]